MNRRRTALVLAALVFVLLMAGFTRTRAIPATAPTTTATIAPTTVPVAGLTVAILDFKADTPADPEFGQQVAEILVASLSGEQGVRIVDRSSLSRVLSELELSSTGLVSTEQALKVGKVIGAQLLVSGKVFTSGKQVFITAKVIGVETTLVEGVIVKGDSADLPALMMQLAERLSKKIVDAGPRLTGGHADAVDPLPALKQKLAGRRLPRVAVRITERHINPANPVPGATDPAAETEVRKMLTSAGVTIIDGDEKEWAGARVELVLTGDAFSEPGPKIGNLITCTDRVEIKLKRLKDGVLVLSDRDSNRAADLTENLAAKSALQKSGRLLGIRVLEYLVESVPGK